MSPEQEGVSRSLIDLRGLRLLLIWSLLLLILFIRGGSAPLFYDLLSQTDVTHLYDIERSTLRYILEPLCGLAFHLASKDLEWAVFYLTGFVIWRFLKRRQITLGGGWLTLFSYVFWISLLGALLTLLMFGSFYGRGILETYAIRAVQAVTFLSYAIFFLLFIYMRLSQKSKLHRLIAHQGTLGRFCSGFSLLLAINVLLISLPLPTGKIITTLGPNEELLDLHVHTNESDAYLKPAWRIH